MCAALLRQMTFLLSKRAILPGALKSSIFQAMSVNYEEILGAEAASLLEHQCQGMPKDTIQTPGPNWVDEVLVPSDRSAAVQKNLAWMLSHGRLSLSLIHI